MWRKTISASPFALFLIIAIFFKVEGIFLIVGSCIAVFAAIVIGVWEGPIERRNHALEKKALS